MKIGILGSANMRRLLCILWAEQEHQVFLFFGGRTTHKGEAVAEVAGNSTQGSTNDKTAYQFKRLLEF